MTAQLDDDELERLMRNALFPQKSTTMTVGVRHPRRPDGEKKVVSAKQRAAEQLIYVHPKDDRN